MTRIRLTTLWMTSYLTSKNGQKARQNSGAECSAVNFKEELK